MSNLRLFIGRILRFFHFIAGVFRRALCFMKKREHIGELPFTVTHSAGQPINSSPVMDSWDKDFQWSEKAIVENKIDEWRRNKEVNHREQNDGPDFFNDMVPEIKKQKKVILKPKISPTVAAPSRNLFEFKADSVPTGAELGDMDENQAWDDDISSTLQEVRMEKQKARHEEYERRMMTRKGIYGQS